MKDLKNNSPHSQINYYKQIPREQKREMEEIRKENDRLNKLHNVWGAIKPMTLPLLLVLPTAFFLGSLLNGLVIPNSIYNSLSLDSKIGFWGLMVVIGGILFKAWQWVIKKSINMLDDY